MVGLDLITSPLRRLTGTLGTPRFSVRVTVSGTLVRHNVMIVSDVVGLRWGTKRAITQPRTRAITSAAQL